MLFRLVICKSRESGNTWSNMQICPWSTEWSRTNANRVWPKGHTGHSKFFQQHMRRLHMDITGWWTLKSDWLYSLQPKMEKFYTVRKNKTRSWLWLRSWTPYAKFRLKLIKVGKTIRPLSFDLNQIPSDYTVEVTKRFKWLDLIECLKNYGQRFMTLMYRVMYRR